MPEFPLPASQIDDSAHSPSTPAAQWAEFFRGILALATAGLLIVQLFWTAPLWLPWGELAQSYPRIPFWSALCHAPIAIESVGLGLLGLGLLTGLVGLLCNGLRTKRLGLSHSLRFCTWGLIGLGLLWLILFNQHRFQVWAWQILLYSLCLGFLSAERCLVWMRRLTISLYFYSAISKCDAAFLDTYGQTLLEGAFTAFPFLPQGTEATQRMLVMLFPLGELLVAALLSVRQTSRWGMRASLVMHVLLICVLGPLGLNHHPPVLLWNLFFLIQNPILFSPAAQWTERVLSVAQQEQSLSSITQPIWRERIAMVALGFSLIFPATEWVNLCDIWPSWGLYSARGARLRMYVTTAQAARLPDEWQRFLGQESFASPWRQVDLHQRSLVDLNVPAYPEDRFQFAAATALWQQYLPDENLRLLHHSTANRWTGRRTTTEISTPAEREAFRERFWLNTEARETSP